MDTLPLHLSGRVTDLAAGLQVRRILPAAARRAVGPFVFFDHFGPVTLPAQAGSDVGAHPHIGLATVTYLFEGSMLHRDSLGTVQAITPGAINWMTAGRGIAHSERTTDTERGTSRRLHGLQLWVALPPALEDMDPGFQHVAAHDVPMLVQAGGVQVRILVGSAFGCQSPVATASPTLYLDVRIPAHTAWELPPLAAEMAVYSPQSTLHVDDEALPACDMLVLPGNTTATLRSTDEEAHVVVIGGAPLEKPVRMWWNFVSSDKSKIAAAAKRWSAGGFDAIAGESDRIVGPAWVD